MKTKYLFLSVCLLYCLSLRAEYVPILQVGKTWEFHGGYVDMSSNTTDYFRDFVTITKDTIINDKKYYVFNDGTCMREDSEKQEVYLYDKNSIQDNLFYKFNVNVGDTLKNIYTPNEPLCPNFYHVVDSVLLLHSQKLIYLSAIPLCSEGNDYYRVDESLKEIWLEGVGNINNPKYKGPYYRSYWDLNIVGVSYMAILMSVYNGEDIFYQYKNSPLHTLRPFPDTWYCINENRSAGPNPNGQDICYLKSEMYQLSDDTIVNDKLYKKLVGKLETDNRAYRTIDIGGIRFNNDSSKIYFRPWNYTSTDDYLLYDYTINIGDTVNAFFRGVDDWQEQELDYIDSVVMPMVCKDVEIKNGHLYYTMECEFSKKNEGIKHSFYWIEGVGTEYGLFANANTISQLEERISDHPLICATINDAPLFFRPDGELKHIGRYGVKNNCYSFEEINTAVDMIKEEIDTDAPMYNILGQQIGKNYRGIVIKNGKKYLKL